MGASLMKELKKIIQESEVMKEDDSQWPEPDRVGRQELEIVMGDTHISFTVRIELISLLKNLVASGHLFRLLTIDCKDWLVVGCTEKRRSRGSPCVLLSGARLEMSGVFAHFAAFQNQAYLRDMLLGCWWVADMGWPLDEY